MKGLLESWGQYYKIQLSHTKCQSNETQNKFKTLESPVYILHGHQNKHVTLCWSWDSRGHFRCCCLPDIFVLKPGHIAASVCPPSACWLCSLLSSVSISVSLEQFGFTKRQENKKSSTNYLLFPALRLKSCQLLCDTRYSILKPCALPLSDPLLNRKTTTWKSFSYFIRKN